MVPNGCYWLPMVYIAGMTCCYIMLYPYLTMVDQEQWG
jgi:hypothetical protein